MTGLVPMPVAPPAVVVVDPSALAPVAQSAGTGASAAHATTVALSPCRETKPIRPFESSGCSVAPVVTLTSCS